jgi:hypothetical protein
MIEQIFWQFQCELAAGPLCRPGLLGEYDLCKKKRPRSRENPANDGM